MNVLKVRISGQRIKYEVAKVTFEDSDLLKARLWKWDNSRNSLYCNDNKLDIIRDYKDFDCINAGVAISPSSSVIYYEMGKTTGRTTMDNVNMLTAINHPVLTAIKDANNGEGLTHTSAKVYDKENTIYNYTLEVRDGKSFDPSLLEIISIKCPITEQKYIVDVRYDGMRMDGGTERLLFREKPVSKTEMLSMTKEYADALGLAESKRLVNILGFDDFLKEECRKDGKKLKISEDYIHSFIDEHERGVEPEEEE
jgi:hypothetical protein